MKLGSLLRIMRLCAGLDQTEMARRLEVSQPTVSRWEKGGCLPAETQAEAWLAACRDCDTSETSGAACGIVSEWYALEDASCREQLAPRLDQAAISLACSRSLVCDSLIPYFADIAAGRGEVQEQRAAPRRRIGVPREIFDRDPGCYALRVTGDSMSPQLLDGDLVVVSPAALLIDGCMVAAYVEPCGDIVKLYRELPDGVIELAPVNPAYKTITIIPGGERNARIWGRIVLQQREL